jgi:acetolactate synthase-1/2/3 large subunit
MGYQKFPECGARVLADTELAIPALTEMVRARTANDPKASKRIAERTRAIGDIHDRTRAKWRDEARHDWDASPISLARLASEVWEQIKNEDWVLTTQAFEDWALKLWDFDKPYRWPGKALGTATQIGMAIGVALAYRGTGRLVVDCQTDGDLMFDAGALWFATKHKIPMLCVMHNNRAYYNDWEHQITVARQRGRPEERAHIGMDIEGPAPDFAGLARSMGWYAEGPIDKPSEIAPALGRAIAQVKAGKPALIDTITQHTG